MSDGLNAETSDPHGPDIVITVAKKGDPKSVTGLGVVGSMDLARNVLTTLINKLGDKATLEDLQRLTPQGNTITSDDPKSTK